MSNILIIGGSSGIGLQLARQLGESGHTVYATYHTHPQENESNIHFHPYNVLDEAADLSFLPASLDGLVYCPGSIVLKPFHRLKTEEFAADYQLQVLGAVSVIQKALPALKASANASVVLFSTLAVQTGLNFHSLVAASKGAIEGMSRALAAELAPGIRVNCIAPSLTDTPLAGNLMNTEDKRQANAQRHPLKRTGTAADIAHIAEFLLSERASWITGQIMHIDGGMSALR